MGKASSSKKVARAARAAGRPGSRRSLGWPLLITSVVVVGVLLVVLSRNDNPTTVAPKLGDHWHAAYGIYDCDHFIPNLVDVKTPDTTGLHTHGDGLMHMHPFATRYTGHGANIGHWGEMTGLKVTDTSIKAAGISRKNGDKCGKKAGTLELMTWDSPTAKTGHVVKKDFADYAPQEFTVWVLAFVPEGTDIPKPDQSVLDALQSPSDVSGGSNGATSTVVPAPGSTDTSAPDSSSTTAPTGSTGSTATTEPVTTVPPTTTP
ncbi:MAG: hypothetical protein V7636_2512 [Actinomycetota bacterium]|jgi:hypothetical protein